MKVINYKYKKVVAYMLIFCLCFCMTGGIVPDSMIGVKHASADDNITFTVRFHSGGTNDLIKTVTMVTNGQYTFENPKVSWCWYNDVPTYEFSGWAFSENGSPYFGGDGITTILSTNEIYRFTTNGVLDLYSTWTIRKSYNLDLYLDDGTSLCLSKRIFKGATYGNLPVPTKSGYYFLGWYTSLSGGTKITSDTIVNVTKDQVLYARFNKSNIGYFLFLHSGNGEFINSETGKSYTQIVASISYETEFFLSSTSLNTGDEYIPKKTGYVITKWNTDENGNGTEYQADTNVSKLTSKSGSLFHLYAQWQLARYIVNFETNGGTNQPNQYVTYSGTYGSLPIPSKTGYTFEGWYADKNLSTKVTKDTKITTEGNRTLYAKWTPITYKISFNANGGSGSMSDITATYDTSIKLTSNAFSKTGYTFMGWSDSANGSVKYANQASVKNLGSAAGDKITLYAKWGSNTYNVKFNGNGSTGGSMSNQTFAYDVSQKLNANKFTKTGYIFAGWALSASGNKAYGDAATVVNLTGTNNGTVNLYAKWTPITY
nr:InlB B-repeat-containing protein [Lachnospiraceae bacterium]